METEIINKALVASKIEKMDRYTLKEAQIITGASIETIRRMLRDGSLKGQRIGRKWLYIYHDDLSRLFEQKQ